MSRIAIITGSTRPDRVNLDVANWVLERATQRGDADYELVDIADFNLPPWMKPCQPATVSTLASTPRPSPRRSPDSTASPSSPASTTTPSRQL